MAEQKRFHNGKELLDSCIQKLNERDNGKTGGNVALHPTVIVFVGEKSKKYAPDVKEILDDNWNNARFLQYLHVVKQGEQWSCSTFPATVADEEVSWKHLCDECGQGLDEVILKMLETDERIFVDKSRIKMEFILDSTEESGKEYYDLILKARNSFQAEDLKTLFLMIDQRPGTERVERSEALLRYIIKQEAGKVQNGKSKLGTTYFLSNYLESGDILGDNKLHLNYRLVANIVLLGGNRSGEGQYITNLYNGIKTASYALVTKPTNAIAAVSLLELMKQIYDNDKQQFERAVSEKDIKGRLGIDDRNGFAFAEEWFRKKMVGLLPDADALWYLPFESEKTFKEFQKLEDITSDVADAYTYGEWSVYVQQQYLNVAQKLWHQEDARQFQESVKTRIRQAFSLFELLLLEKDKRQDEVRQIICRTYQYGGTGQKGSYVDKLHTMAMYEVKKTFYENLKELMVDEFNRLLEAAKEFQRNYQIYQEEIERERVVLDTEIETADMTNISSVYSEQVKRYVEQHKKYNEVQTAFPNVFNITGSKEDILLGFWNVFMELIQSEIYNYDFEHEVDFRMNSMSDIKRKSFTDELQKALQGSIRLKSVINVHMQKSLCFYMVNADADYAKELADADGYGTDYMLFKLNRTDCIEQIEIHNITDPENLHVYQQE